MTDESELAKETTIDQPSEEDVSPEVERRERLADALTSAGHRDAYVTTREDAREVLDEHREAILDYLRDHEVDSVSDLADALDRDTGNVSRDLQVLADHGIVNLTVEGARRSPNSSTNTSSWNHSTERRGTI
jgi:predicted transcriptional regulator